MAKLRKSELLNIIVQAINDCGWNVLYVGNISEHPFLLKIYNDSEAYLLRIYIWNLTHGGGKRRSDEYRVQVTGVEQFEQQAGEKTLILGWWDDIGVFAGFDYTKHTGKLGASPSMQIKEESLRNALINGFSPCNKGNSEIAIAFRSDFFINYTQNLQELHSFGVSENDFRILEEVSNKPLERNNELISQVSTKQRQTSIIQLTKKLRDASFRARVLSAYSNKCAFSGLQLKLVDAAHILPVSHEKSTDETANGIALSALYHRAYDKGLVTFDDDYRIIVNEHEMRRFKENNFDGGMKHFIDNLRPIIIVPPSVSDRPNINFVRDANTLRGWEINSSTQS